LGRSWPALDVRSDNPDILLAAVDDFSPSALEPRDDGVRLFFATRSDRDAAHAALAASGFSAAPIDVPDDDWARRSQEGLQPITVGRITVDPNPAALLSTSSANPEARVPNAEPRNAALCTVVIPASMAFGTGHHATTQLCLEALQTIDLAGASVLDVGTGSGVLAIAAVRIGAARALGIDVDPDAIEAARGNLALNPGAGERVRFDVGDVASLGDARGVAADVVTANLTGALLVRTAPLLAGAVRSGGTLILSGLQTHERTAVVRAFPDIRVEWEREVDEWVALVMKK
jgi:ribosomal protein L11 methyltransferase